MWGPALVLLAPSGAVLGARRQHRAISKAGVMGAATVLNARSWTTIFLIVSLPRKSIHVFPEA